MEMILLIGIPASGKSSFYKTHLFRKYMRISLDLYKNRNREMQFLTLALSLQQCIAIDNTNVTRADRATYISMAKERGYSVEGYYFKSQLSQCIERNVQRQGKECISTAGVISKYKNLQLPQLEEGFNRLYYVVMENESFTIKDWTNEI
ncbi:AAA family ATPase [Ohtaekwangia kribbensis]|jgi:predicted kinase|uniref:AAA family ATPase n=1 Tax=Ohtaekwangia kribbensis TaxID=688913 RepID=A0ABW3K0R8_9BACT